MTEHSKQTPDDGGPAFPEPGSSGLPNGEWIYGRSGMSLRDWFAGQALTGYLLSMPSASSFPAAYEELAEKCFRAADAMLAARAQGGAS